MSTHDTEDRLRWQKVQTLFHQAVSLPEAERPAYLQNACQGDDSLLSDVASMLEEDARKNSFIDQPLPDVAHSLLTSLPNSFADDEFRQYTIRELLGEGGAGVVYLAERADLGSQVAIKILSSGTLSPSRRQRFADEQRTLAQLDHPFIARILDADTLRDGTPWFAMEYVEGQPIAAYCQANKCSLEERLVLFRAVCEAVQYAHAHAIIHRDLKPSNILVRADATVKLLDFGIAKQLRETEAVTLTKTGLRPMTLAYASPEQIRGQQINTQSDVYSLGVVLYELLTGRLPFDLSDKSTTEAERMVLEDLAKLPSMMSNDFAELSRSARSDLDVLCLTAMHRDPLRRYRSAEALIRDIDHYLKGEPLEARPDSLRYRVGKFVRRNRRPLSAVAAALVIIAGLTLYFTIRLTRARDVVLAEARRTQRVEQFMLNLFDGSDRRAAPSVSLPAVKVIDRGVSYARALDNEPAIQADLFETLGNVYKGLGRLDNADSLLRSSVDKRKAIYGSDSAQEAEALVSLGMLRLYQARLDDAEKLVRQGLAMSAKHLPPDDPQVAAAMSALGHVLNDRGAYPEAIKVLEKAMRLQSQPGAPAADLATTIGQLADAQYYSGHYAEATALNNQALTMDRQLYGNVHPAVADDLVNLGQIQHDLGNDAQAEKYYRQALAIKRSWYGDDHPETAMTMSAVGQALIYQARYDEAAPILQQALSIQERFYGKVHTQVAMGLNMLAMLDLKRKHLKEAETEFTRMAEINRVIQGEKSYLTGVAALGLALVYQEQGNYARAESSDRAALQSFLENLPAGHQDISLARSRLGHVLLLERKYPEAETYLVAGYEGLMKLPNPPASRLLIARTDLAAVYDALHKPELANNFRTQLQAASSAHPDASVTSK